MNTPRIPESVSNLTSGALVALGAVASWIAFLALLPQTLEALTRFITEGSDAYSTARREAILTRHEDRLLGAVALAAALQYIQQARNGAAQALVADSEADGPPRESPS